MRVFKTLLYGGLLLGISVVIGVGGAMSLDYLTKGPETRTLSAVVHYNGTLRYTEEPDVVSMELINGPLTLCIEVVKSNGARTGICDVQVWALE